MVVQLLLVLAIGWFVWVIVRNTQINLQNRNIASGFRFLWSTAGFGVNQALISYNEASSYGRALLVGFLNTLLVAGVGIVCATVLGFILGIMRLSRNWLVAKVAEIYIEVIRNIPLLLQIFVWYATVLKPLPPPARAPQIGLPWPGGGFIIMAAVLGGGLAVLATYTSRRWLRQLLLSLPPLGVSVPTFWVGLLLVFPRFFWMGFWNYCLALVLFWFILGYCLRRRGRMRLPGPCRSASESRASSST